MSPEIREEIQKLHPFHLQKFMELIAWSNAGGTGVPISDIAYEKALNWAKQVEIPPPAPEEPFPGEE